MDAVGVSSILSAAPIVTPPCTVPLMMTSAPYAVTSPSTVPAISTMRPAARSLFPI
jgi:hypothetical protein